jgi:hypothetical protein
MSKRWRRLRKQSLRGRTGDSLCGARALLRLATALAGVATVLGVGVGSSAASGVYTVTSCGADANATAWVLYNGFPPGIRTGRECGMGGVNGGLFAEDYLGIEGGGAGGNGPGAIGAFTLTAPAGTTIKSLTYSRYMDKAGDDGSWRVQARATRGVSNSILEECYYDPAHSTNCHLGIVGGTVEAFDGLSASSLSFGIWCTPYGGGGGCGSGYAIHSAHIVVYSTAVTISDPVAPDQVSLTGVPSGWQHGTIQVTAAGRDALGIKKREILIDGVVKGTANGSCDYTMLTPCTSPGQVVSGQVNVDTTGIPEGTYPIAARVSDAADNATSVTNGTIRIDNSTPAAPSVSRVGPVWTNEAVGRQVSVHVPTQQGSPIASIRTQACLGTDCTATTTTSAQGVGTQLVDVPPLTQDGLWTVRTWLRDEAGNESSPGIATTTPVGVDTVAPTAVLHAPTAVDEGRFLNAGFSDVQEPVPSSGDPTTSLTISVDGGAAVPLLDDTIVAAADHTYLVTLVVSDPAGNASVTSRSVSVIPQPPVTTPTTATTTSTTPTITTTPDPPPITQPTTATTTTTTTTTTTPPPRSRSGLTIDLARIRTVTVAVSGRATRALAGRRVSIRLGVRAGRHGVSLRARPKIGLDGRWATTLRLPKGTVRADLARRTVRASTTATTTVRSGTAIRRLRR